MEQEKVGLKIVDLLHDITQLGYRVYFADDFDGMITVGFAEEYGDGTFYEHNHCGFPGCERIRLEKDILESLTDFIRKAKENEQQNK